MKLTEKTVGILKNYFAIRPSVAVVFLFGSYAKATANKESDIDLGILFNNKTESPFASDEITIMQELTAQVGIKTEIQDLEKCSLEFAQRVLSEGKLIYSANENKRVAFTEMVLRDYFDMQPAREEYYYYLHQMAKKGALNARYG